MDKEELIEKYKNDLQPKSGQSKPKENDKELQHSEVN